MASKETLIRDGSNEKEVDEEAVFGVGTGVGNLGMKTVFCLPPSLEWGGPVGGSNPRTLQ